jgi:cobalamin biosynthesis protein CbiD
VVDERAMQAAGLLDDQLQSADDMAAAALDAAQNPPQAAAAKTPMEKMLLASLARRIIKMQGGAIHTHKHNRKRR